MKRKYSGTKSIMVDIDVDLSEWDDDELVTEMKERGFVCIPNTEQAVAMDALSVYEDWKLRGRDAYDRMVDFVLIQAGRIA